MTQKLLYQRIVDDIQEKVNTGMLKPGEQVPSVAAIRQSFQVSHITALRALKELTAKEIIGKQPGRGYFVTPSNLAETSIRTIGCLMRDISVYDYDHYFNQIMHGIQKEANAFRMNTLFPHIGTNIDTHQVRMDDEILKSAVAQKDIVVGFLLDARIPDSLVKEIIDATGKPVVVVDRESKLPVNSVSPDNRQGMEQLLKNLKRMGYDRFIYADSGLDEFNQCRRRAIFPQLMKEYGVEAAHWRLIGDFSVLSHEIMLPRLMEAISELKGRRLAIICSADGFARMVICTNLLEKDFRIPEDVGLSGFGGMLYATYCKPELTTLKVDCIGMGSLAVKLLLNEVAGSLREPRQSHLLPVNLIFGETI